MNDSQHTRLSAFLMLVAALALVTLAVGFAGVRGWYRETCKEMGGRLREDARNFSRMLPYYLTRRQHVESRMADIWDWLRTQKGCEIGESWKVKSIFVLHGRVLFLQEGLPETIQSRLDHFPFKSVLGGVQLGKFPTKAILWARRGDFIFGVMVRPHFFGSPECCILVGLLWAVFVCVVFWMFGRAVWFEHAARRLAAQKTTFVSNVSHELKTPLTSILGYAEMLESGLCRSEEKRRRALKVIGEEGRRLNRMVTELLEFSRLERGTSQYHPTEFDVSIVVEETVERLSPGFAEHGLHVQKGERVWGVADCDKVKEILENLLTNARKYAAADGPVELSLEKMSDCVRIHVCDRGPGMTEDQRRHAFEPFWRADDAITKRTGGYGIGLPLARGYARGMGGDLTVSARAGGGCDFVLTLPLKHETKEHENG